MDLTAAPLADPLDMAVERELGSGERLLWRSRPIRRVRHAHFGMWIFAVPWTAFSLFWTGAASLAVGAGWKQIGA